MKQETFHFKIIVFENVFGLAKETKPVCYNIQ